MTTHANYLSDLDSFDGLYVDFSELADLDESDVPTDDDFSAPMPVWGEVLDMLAEVAAEEAWLRF